MVGIETKLQVVFPKFPPQVQLVVQMDLELELPDVE